MKLLSYVYSGGGYTVDVREVFAQLGELPPDVSVTDLLFSDETGALAFCKVMNKLIQQTDVNMFQVDNGLSMSQECFQRLLVHPKIAELAAHQNREE